MANLWLGVVNIGKWLWAVVKYPLNFDKHLKLLEEVNAKLDSPSRYNQELQFFKETYTLRIEEAKKEAGKLSASDLEKKAQIEDLVKKLEQANEAVEGLIESNSKIIEQRDVFHKAFQASEELKKQLSKELEKYKLEPLPSSSLAMILLGGYPYSLPKGTLGQLIKEKTDREAQNKFAEWLKPNK